MKILSNKPTVHGGRYVLVDYGNNFFAYGYEVDMHTLCGFPVNQCGTKEKVLNHLKSVIGLCNKNIEKYQKEFAKDNHEGWSIMIDHQRHHMETLTEFETILTTV